MSEKLREPEANIPRDYYDTKFAEIPAGVLQKSMVVFDKYLSDLREPFKTSHGFEGSIDWFIKRWGHFTLGMRIRNLLRSEGLTDDLLPDKNWDDSYIQALERWIGVR